MVISVVFGDEDRWIGCPVLVSLLATEVLAVTLHPSPGLSGWAEVIWG